MCAAMAMSAAWLSNAGPLNPPPGPIDPTGLTLIEIGDLIQMASSGDACECQDLVPAYYTMTSNTSLLATGQNYYIKRISIAKSFTSSDVTLQLKIPGGSVIGAYRLRPDEGSLVADVDLVVDGLETFSTTVSTGSIQVALTYKPVP